MQRKNHRVNGGGWTYGSSEHVKHEGTKAPPVNGFVVATVDHDLRGPDNTTHSQFSTLKKTKNKSNAKAANFFRR